GSSAPPSGEHTPDAHTCARIAPPSTRAAIACWPDPAGADAEGPAGRAHARIACWPDPAGAEAEVSAGDGAARAQSERSVKAATGPIGRFIGRYCRAARAGCRGIEACWAAAPLDAGERALLGHLARRDPETAVLRRRHR